MAIWPRHAAFDAGLPAALERATRVRAGEQRLFVLEGGEWRWTHAHATSTLLDPTNHAPALFDDSAAIDRAQQAHTIEIKDKHTFILDLFSGQKLNTRTQTATLRYREKERALKRCRRTGRGLREYQRARKASVMTQSEADAKATTILREMLRGDRASVRLRRYLLIILGPAASGKTTLLKTFMVEMVHTFPDFVPVLMPVIEVTPVLDECDRDSGESVVVAFVQRKFPQHAHLLLQMILMRRAVFLFDGIDESGTYREAVEEFITVELLEQGHKTIITSRHSGLSDAFRQCSWWSCRCRQASSRRWCRRGCPTRQGRALVRSSVHRLSRTSRATR